MKQYGVFIVLLVIIGAGFFWSVTRDNQIKDTSNERVIDFREFLIGQCERDAFRDRIIIGALEDAKRRANKSLSGNPLERIFEVAQLQQSIDLLKAQKGDCLRSVPPPPGKE